jgi:hypothetical protein
MATIGSHFDFVGEINRDRCVNPCAEAIGRAARHAEFEIGGSCDSAAISSRHRKTIHFTEEFKIYTQLHREMNLIIKRHLPLRRA